MAATKITNTDRKEIMVEAWKSFNSNLNINFDGNKEMTFGECLTEAWQLFKYDAKKSVNGSGLKNESVKEIFDMVNLELLNADEILIVVAENSKGFQADIAKKAILGETLTYKQAWSIAYEFKKVA